MLESAGVWIQNSPGVDVVLLGPLLTLELLT